MRSFEHLAALLREQASSFPVWRRAAVPFALLKNARKTGAGSGAPPKEQASSFPVWRRAAVPFALLKNTRKTGAGSGAPPKEQASSFAVWRRAAMPFALVLLVPVAFGQHGGGGGHPMSAAHPAPAGSGGGGHAAIRTSHVSASRNGRAAIVSTARRPYRNNNRGYGYYSPYFPLSGYGGYSSYLPVYPDDYGAVSAPAAYVDAGPPPAHMAGVAPLPEVASPVIHEYKTDQTSVSAHGPKPNFTIVLKDGTTRTARASWVQGGTLYFVDAQSRQQLLSPAAIDRDATEKANEAKNLAMELPPG